MYVGNVNKINKTGEVNNIIMGNIFINVFKNVHHSLIIIIAIEMHFPFIDYYFHPPGVVCYRIVM